LADAAAEHPRAARRLLVLNSDAVVGVNVPDIQVQPAYEWLLETTAPE
jgi:hypothetical protein